MSSVDTLKNIIEAKSFKSLTVLLDDSLEISFEPDCVSLKGNIIMAEKGGDSLEIPIDERLTYDEDWNSFEMPFKEGCIWSLLF